MRCIRFVFALLLTSVSTIAWGNKTIEGTSKNSCTTKGGPRCVVTRTGMIRHSDIIAMYQETTLDRIKKYRVDIIAWGAQLNPTLELIEKRQKLIEVIHDAGIRFNSIDLAMVQEGGKFLVCDGGARTAERTALYYRLRKDNEKTLRQISEFGIDLKKYGVSDVNGELIGVPWLSNRWFIPMACTHEPLVRKWFRAQIEALMSTGANALHFDEPCMSAYALLAKNPGCFCDRCVAAFRDYLKLRPEEMWNDAGIRTLDGFSYRAFVKEQGRHPTKAPLWKEFVRFHLLSTADFVRELRDLARSKAKGPLPFSTNANAVTWIKFPILPLQDFMSTEVAHSAKSRKIPDRPLLTYKPGESFRQPVVTTAHGNDWYQMKVDQHPVLVSAWIAQAYALGHHMMIPYKAWVMDPVKGSDTYRAVTDHYACLAHWIKSVSHLLDGHEAIATTGVVISCDAIEKDLGAINALCSKLAYAQVPFCTAIEGNDLLEKHVNAEDLSGCSSIILASPKYLTEEAKSRLHKLASVRPVWEYSEGSLPDFVRKPIRLVGTERVWVLPRAVPGDPTAPLAIHLLNRDYDSNKREMKRKGPFRIEIDADLFWNRRFSAAFLHQPRLTDKLPEKYLGISQKLEFKQTNAEIEIRVPDLELWGIIELR